MDKLKNFKDFIIINENKTSNSSVDVMEKLANYITRRFNNEDRILFTYWIGEIFDLSKFLIVSNLELSEADKDVVHVYIKLNDKYYDGSGFHTIEDLYKEHHFSKWTFKDFTYNGSLTDVKRILDTKKVKLNSNQITELKHILEKFKEKIK